MYKFAEDSKTRVNLMRAFEEENFAKEQYSFFCEIAQKEGLNNLSQLFLEISSHKEQHLQTFYNFLSVEDKDLINYPLYTFSDVLKTSENIIFAKELEEQTGHFLYPLFSKMAREEGYDEISQVFELIAKNELQFHLKLEEFELF